MESNYTIRLESTTSNQTDRVVVKKYEQEDIEDHDHNFFELAYIVSGTTCHRLDQVEHTLTKGNYFIIDYGSKHAYENSHELVLINCLFLPEILDVSLKECTSYEELVHGSLLRYHKLYKGKNSVNRVFTDEDERVYQLIAGMLEEYNEKRIGYREIIKNRLIEIMLLTIRKTWEVSDIEIQNQLVLDTLAYLEKNYAQKNPIQDFVNEYHYAPAYVSRKFREEIGYTPMMYLQKIRMEKSCELLVATELSVPEIAELVGYHDMKFYQKIFRKMIQATPREYRKRNRA